MKTLVDDIKTALEGAVTAGRVRACTVFKGIRNNPDQIPIQQYPYVCLDDGGEQYQDTRSADTGLRTFRVACEFACFEADIENVFDAILDFSNEIRQELEREANRFLDGMSWGVSIEPYTWESDGRFFRGRVVTLEYTKLEIKDFMEH